MNEIRLIDFGDLGQIEYDERPPSSWFAIHDGFAGTAHLPLADLAGLAVALDELRQRLQQVQAVSNPYPYCTHCGREVRP